MGFFHYRIAAGVSAALQSVRSVAAPRSHTFGNHAPSHLIAFTATASVTRFRLESGMDLSSRGRVVLVEDEAFTRNLVAGAIASQGWEVSACTSVADAIAAIQESEPHVVVCDLDLGPGPSGVDLCQRLVEEWPWIGIVVLTAHTSPELAVASPFGLPNDIVYLVKSAVSSPQQISEAIDSAIHGRYRGAGSMDRTDVIELSAEQGEVLRLIAGAYSNTAIAEHRGTTLRAAEAMVHRVFLALDIDTEPGKTARVQAAMMWNSGRINIR